MLVSYFTLEGLFEGIFEACLDWAAGVRPRDWGRTGDWLLEAAFAEACFLFFAILLYFFLSFARFFLN